MNLLEQIAWHLASCGLGTVAGASHDGNIYWGRMPDPPDDCICVFSSDTGVPGSYEGARIQIINRAKSPRTAYETSVSIADALDGFSGFLAQDGYNARIEIVNSGVGLGPDTKKRELYSTNIRVYYCM